MLTVPAIGTWGFFCSLIFAALVIEPNSGSQTLSIRPLVGVVHHSTQLAADPAFWGMCTALAITLLLSRLTARTIASISAKETWYLANGCVM